VTGLNFATAIAAQSSSANLRGIAVGNGSISDFGSGVVLSADGSVVEGLRVISFISSGIGIEASGIVRGNIVAGFDFHTVAIIASGIVTGNFVSDSNGGISIGRGSAVIGNTVVNTGPLFGIGVNCPSNVTDNTANIFVLSGDGCTNTNNVAP
jgi:hypothetical protein